MVLINIKLLFLFSSIKYIYFSNTEINPLIYDSDHWLYVTFTTWVKCLHTLFYSYNILFRFEYNHFTNEETEAPLDKQLSHVKCRIARKWQSQDLSLLLIHVLKDLTRFFHRFFFLIFSWVTQSCSMFNS